MAEETTTTNEPASTPDVPEAVASPVEDESTPASPPPPVEATAIEAPASNDAPVSSDETTAPTAAEPPSEPDELQAFIDKAFETIQHEVESAELDKFLRAHIKTFREEWDIWSDSAKDTYVHMMASQLVQRKAATTRIMNYEEFKLPVPSAQTTLFESLKQSQVKPLKRQPVLLMPPNLRPTYSLKK